MNKSSPQIEEKQDKQINFDELDGAIEEVSNIQQNQEQDQEGLPQIDKDTVEKHQLRLKVLRWRETFPNYLESYGERLELEHLETLNEDQLKKLLDEISITVGCANSSKLISSAYIGTLGVIEGLGPKLNMHLNGLQMAMLNDQLLNDQLKETSLIYEIYVTLIQFTD